MAGLDSCQHSQSGSDIDAAFATEFELKSHLLQALQNIEGPSAFAGGNVDANLPNPGLDIHGHGVIGVPLSVADAHTIKAQCHRSAFGKGAKTYVDDNFRSSWELNSTQFTLRNPRWDHAVQSLLPQIRELLNIAYRPQDIRAELYKLLLYEEGAFFKEHQDSEKTPGMFGTLMIALPSLHQGGDLALRHQKECYQFSTATNSNFGCSWAAWYSDVFHEVRPVTSGTRLVLTYNLAIKREGGAPVSIPPTLSSFQPRLKAVMRGWNSKVHMMTTSKYLVHRLDHQYTKANLRLDSLKGRDRGQVEALKAIALQADCAVFLATMERTLHCDDDYGSEDGIFDSELGLSVITTLEGSKIGEHFPIDQKHLLEEERDSKERTPDDEEHEGYTGNEGCPATYWYRDTVLVIVPGNAVLSFTIRGAHKDRMALEKLLELKESGLSSKLATSQFRQLATILLADEDKYGPWSFPPLPKKENDPHDIALKELALLALQPLNLEVFNRCADKLGTKLPLECFYALGGSLTHTLEGQESIKSAIVKQDYIAPKYEAYQNIQYGFEEACRIARDSAETAEIEQSQPEESTVRAWFDRELIGLVAVQKNLMRKIDGQALAAMSVRGLSNTRHSRQIQDLAKANTSAVKAVFCSRLNQAINGPERTDTEHVAFLCVIIKDFWDTIIIHGAAADFHNLVRPANYATSTDFSMTALELVDMLSISQVHLEKVGLSKTEIYRRLDAMVGSAKAEELVALHMPFAKMITANEVEFATDDGISAPAAELINKIIYRYVLIYVGTKPLAPRDWNLSASRSRCSCSDCFAVNTFLASPSQTVGKFPMNKNRRQHLHKNFTDRAAVGSYSVTTTRNSNPHVWQITKNFSVHEAQLNAWKSRAAGAKHELQMMDGAEMRLKPILGDAYADLMKLKVPTTAPQPLEERDTNCKRAAPDTEAGGPRKKVLATQPSTNAAWIDLTED